MSLDNGRDPSAERPPVSRLQAGTFALTAAILFAGAVTFIAVGRGFVIVLAGLCATVVMVAGLARDMLRR